ncbi:GHKL domain-containing protein [Clostridium tetani]|uniref:GHKL domain-containing protein n=1 Tax=Clostridium tetani TaxID=1513 RepID=UPI0023B99E3E|nr:GHKL domain-containing protein [Clostridium tetani]
MYPRLSFKYNLLNSCNKSVNIAKIYKLGYSTKDFNRGIGLQNVKDIIDKKYDNVLLQTNFNEDVFIQELYIKFNKK